MFFSCEINKKKSTIQGVWKDACSGEIFSVYDCSFCSTETQTCSPSFHSLLHFIAQVQMETSIWTSIPARSSLWVLHSARFSDTLGWYPLRQASDFMSLQPLHPTSPSTVDISQPTAGTSGTICKIPVHSKLIPDLKVSLEQDLNSC